MQVASLVLGILAILGMSIAFIPCFGSLNWINIPFSAVGLVVSIVAFATTKREEERGGSITGIVCCAIAVMFGLVRLILGGGVL